MPFIFFDGFADRLLINNLDDYDGYGLYESVYYGDSAYKQEARQTGRYGDYCAMLPDIHLSYAYINMGWKPVSGTVFRGGCAINSLDEDGNFLSATSATRYGPLIEFDSAGEVTVRRAKATSGSETVARSSAGARATNWGWHYVEFEFRVTPDATDYIKIWIDGELVLDHTGLLNTTGAIENIIFPYSISAIDDIWLRDDNTAIGEPRILAIFPDGAGTDSEGTPVGDTPNYVCVDDFEQDFDGSYNLVTLGQKDSFQMSSLEVSSGTIYALCARFLCQGEPGNTDQIRPYVIVNSTKYNGSSYAVNNDYWRYVEHIWETNPDTSSPWTVSDINNVQIGYEVV